MSGGMAALHSYGLLWVEAIWRASWQGGLAVLAAWAAVRLAPRIPPQVQCWLWRLAYLKLLLAFVWATPVEVPLLRAQLRLPAVPVVSPGDHSRPTLLSASPPGQATARSSSAPASSPAGTADVLLLLWLAGVVGCGSRALAQWRRTLRLRAGAAPVEDALLLAARHELSARLGLRRAARLLASETTGSPLLVGCFRPAIILPASLFPGWGSAEIRLVLAHELAHQKRRDLLWSCMPAIAHALFYFQPLVWLAAREWRLAHEVACDELALHAADSAALPYAELLLKLATRRRSPLAAGPGMAAVVESFQQLRRRLTAMQDLGSISQRRRLLIGSLVAAVGVPALVPWRAVALGTTAPESWAARRPVTSWGDQKDGLQLGIEFAGGKQDYRFGDRVTLLVKLRNVTRKPLALSYRKSFFHEVGPGVTSQGGPPAEVTGYQAEVGKVPAATVTLAPGQTVVLSRETCQVGPRGTTEATRKPGIFAEPGPYTLTRVFLWQPKQAAEQGSLSTFGGKALASGALALRISGRGTDPALMKYEPDGVILAGVRTNDRAALDQIAAQYVRYVEALRKGDAAVLDTLAAPDFVFDINDHGPAPEGLRAVNAVIALATGFAKPTTNSIRVRRLTANENRAVAVVEQSITGTIDPPPDPGPVRPEGVTLRWTWEHTWVRTARGWKLQRAAVPKS